MDEDILFDVLLAQIEAAFVMRHPEARSRATRLRDNLMARVQGQIKSVELSGPAARMAVFSGSIDVIAPLRKRTKRHQITAESLAEKAAALTFIIEANRHANLESRGKPLTETPERAVRGPSRATTVCRLVEGMKLPIEALYASEEIERVHRVIVTSVAIKARVLDGARGGRPSRYGDDFANLSEWMAWAISKWYRPWAAKLHDLNHWDLVSDVLLEGYPLDQARRLRRCSYATGFSRLRRALVSWGEISGLESRLASREPSIARRRGRRRAGDSSRSTNS